MKKIPACPGWLQLSDDRSFFVFVPERAAIIRKMFELSIGGIGSYAIANLFNQTKVTPFGPSSSWDNTTIDSILRNKATFGEHQPKSYAGGNKKGVPTGPPISGYYPAVIDEATFQAAQVARKRNLVAGRGRKGKNVTNIFAGLTTCIYCNSAVKFHSHGNSKSLICSMVLRSEGCIRAAWSYRDFEVAVLRFIGHPALVASLDEEKRKALDETVHLMEKMSGDDIHSARVELSIMLRRIVTELKIANAGASPTPTLAEALVRRDLPKRFFELRLWDGPTYKSVALG